MTGFRPKYISFDCYGTLTRFRMDEMAKQFYAAHIPADRMTDFLTDWSRYRLDEVLGAWKPYCDVIVNSLSRACAKWKIPFEEAQGVAVYEAVPTWGPHADVPAGLATVADKIPLVILSNAMNSQIQSNVDKLGAPVHRVYTAESAQAYKPRMQAFEFMFDQLGCGPEEMMHVSASFRYDLNTATDFRFGCRVYVNRGYEPSNPAYRDVEIPNIACLPAVVGL